MAENPDKTALIAQLAAARANSTRSLQGLGAALNVPERFQQSVRRNQTSWLAGAGLAGWILARLPARKKRIKVITAKSKDGLGKEVKEVAAAGLFITVLKLVFSLFRPIASRLLTQKLADVADEYIARRTGGEKFGSRSPVRSSSIR